MIETLNTSSQCTPPLETLDRLLPPPRKCAQFSQKAHKILAFIPKAGCFVCRLKKKKKKTGRNASILAYRIHQPLHRLQVLHILSFDKTCNLSCSYTSLSHYISLEGTSYVTEEGCVESET